LAYIDNSQDLYIAYAKANPDGQPNYYENASIWSSYQVYSNQFESSRYSPALVAEEGRLALYFASNNPSTGSSNDYGSTQQLLYLYSNNPDATKPSWGIKLGTSSTDNLQSSLPAPYVGDSTQLTFAQGTNTDQYTVSSSISATTYQGRTVLAMTGNGGGNSNNVASIRIATAPSANPAPGDKWLYWANSTPSADYLYGNGYIGITTDQSLLYISTASGYETSQVYGLSPSQTLGSYNLSSSYDGPTSVNYNGNPNIFMHQGVPILAWANTSQSLQTAELEMTVAAPLQPSLSGYSLDGNIDVNGDGFKDILISDPSDPAMAVDNQYVLFGGDYLDIASQVGTAGDDTLIGTSLADVIYSISGSDVVLSKGGADVIYTGSGNDQISILDNSFVRIDAGSGFDQLLLEGLADQDYDFRINVPKPATPSSTQYFVGTKLRDIELISSQDYGANAISLDAAAVNAINPDRVLFLVPDSADSINLTSEFERSSAFDTSYAGGLWYAYVAGPNISTSSNPTLVYVRVPVGESASDWLASQVTLGGQNVSARSSNVSLLSISDTSFSAPPALGAAPTPSAVAGSSSFGDGLTVTAFKTNAQSAIASFQISRSDVSKSQLISYVSSSLNSSAEPGRHYTPVAGLLRLEAGQVSADVSVPIDAAAISALRNGTLSLQVQELADQGQKEFNLLLQPEVNTQEFRPVLSALELLSDPADATGNSISLGFRADINKQAQIAGLATTLKLKVVSRLNADDLLSAATTRAQTLSISDGVLSKFDLDGRSNMQVELELQVSGETGVIGLVAKSGKQPLVLSNLNSSPSTSVVVDIEYSSVDSVLAAPAPKSVILSDIAIDFSVSANGDGNASVYFELPKIAGDLALVDQNGKPIANQHVLLYVVDKIGSLVPFNYDPVLGVGGTAYDVNGDGVVDSVVYKYKDGFKGDLDGVSNGKIQDPTVVGTTIVNSMLSRNSSSSVEVSDPSNASPVNFLLKAKLTGAATTANHLYYVVTDPANGFGIASIAADISLLKAQAISLFATLENHDVMLPSGFSFESGIQLANGKSISIVEVVDASLGDITSATDSRLRVLSVSAPVNSSQSVSFSSSSGVSVTLDLIDTPQGLDALIAQDQAFAPVLDFTAFSASQVVTGTIDIAREASYDALTSFYRTIDDKGTVKDSISGALVRPGEQGYATVALSAANRVDALNGLQVGNMLSTSRSFELQETNYLAPFALVNENTFFAFAAANRDGISHFKMLGENKYGLEDLVGGGDRDYDDQVIGFKFSKVATVI
jgi:hypothetical protein